MHTNSIVNQQALALATSQIHRSRSLQELQNTFLSVAPKFVDADAYGLYLFDKDLQTSSVISHRANQKFLAEYEKIRSDDPLFNYVVSEKRFTHSLAIFEKRDWLQQPLHGFLSRWGLDYSIEAPLVCEGRITGTLNFAIGGKHYFAEESLALAEFLCAEFDATYQRLLELERLRKQAATSIAHSGRFEDLSQRSGQVLELLLGGMSNRQISTQLNISENTVRYHVKQIYRQYGVHNRAQLLRRAYVN